MLTIRNTRVFHGPSLWAPVRAIVLEVDIGELEDRLSKQTPVFLERLVTLVPTLSEFGHVVSQPEGGLRRLLLDRLALALQQNVGWALTFVQTLPANERGFYKAVFEYEHDEVGIAAGTLAVQVLNHLLFSSEPEFDFDSELKKLAKIASSYAPPRLMGIVISAAKRRGIPVLPLQRSPAIFQLGNGTYQRRLYRNGTATSDTAHLASLIAQNKALTSRLLREAGLPVPNSVVVQDPMSAAKAAAAIGYPVVVKPLDGNHARGAMIELRGDEEVREAFPLAMGQSLIGQVIVERFIPGMNYRILIINNKLIGVLERPQAHVVGDGRHTVAELVEITNADPRRIGDEAILKPIVVDEHTVKVLTKQDVTLEDVPEEGRFVSLKQVANAELGGANIDRTDEIHPDNVEIARQAAKVIGLDIAGIDFITPDITRSAYDVGGAINEVNAQPGFLAHIQPTEGTPRDVPAAILDLLFPPGEPVQVPVIAVSGADDATATTRLIARILTTASRNVGMTTSEGMYIRSTRIAAGDQTGPDSARTVLRNPAIDYAVLETAPDGILRDGLGFDRCDVAVVTNIVTIRLGRHDCATPDELARVTAVVLRAVAADGTSILNADDEWAARLADVAGGEILYFSLDERNPVIVQHVRQGGQAVVLRQTPAGEMLTLLAGEEEIALLLATEISATPDGCTQINIANVLAAVAASIARQVPLETIRKALCSSFVTFDEIGERG